MGKIDVTKDLVDLGANVNAADNVGNTPYDIAVQKRKGEVVEYLKEQIIAMINKKDTFSKDENM